MPAMALLDRDGVYGAPRFHMAAKKARIKADIGAEIACDFFFHHRDTLRHAQEAFRSHSFKVNRPPSKYPRKTRILRVPCLRGEIRIPLIVSSRPGYQNLCRLITKMKLRAAKNEGAVCEEELQEHAAGIICLTGGDDGPLATALKRGGIEEARKATERLIYIFGRENVYVELQRHFHREQESRNRAAIDIARRCVFLYWQRMGCAMRKKKIAHLRMCLPRSVIIVL